LIVETSLGKDVGKKGEATCTYWICTRKARLTLCCFAGVHGLVDYFTTFGTFNRIIFFHQFPFVRDIVTSHPQAHEFPGPHSIWIMDGAAIHCDAAIVVWLRLHGIVVIFLPAYCPFFNPIEFMFGVMKSRFKREYIEVGPKKQSVEMLARETSDEFRDFDMEKLFHKCGYLVGGRFEPRVGLNNRKMSHVF
jgi:hypothetical protein